MCDLCRQGLSRAIAPSRRGVLLGASALLVGGFAQAYRLHTVKVDMIAWSPPQGVGALHIATSPCLAYPGAQGLELGRLMSRWGVVRAFLAVLLSGCASDKTGTDYLAT